MEDQHGNDRGPQRRVVARADRRKDGTGAVPGTLIFALRARETRGAGGPVAFTNLRQGPPGTFGRIPATTARGR